MCHFERTDPVSGGDGTRFEEIAIQGQAIELPCYVATPVLDQAPAMLIIHDVTGASPFYQDLARRLANEGFTALLPDYFVRQGPPENSSREAIMVRASRLDQPTTLHDIAHSLRWLREEVTERVGVIGFCMGGTLAMLAAGRDPLPDASVAYYGFPRGRKGWPHIPLDEVDKLRAPVLAMWGDQDHGVGMDNVQSWLEATTTAGKGVESVIYPGLPHGFLTFDPSSPHYEQAQDSWSRTLTFLREKLAA